MRRGRDVGRDVEVGMDAGAYNDVLFCNQSPEYVKKERSGLAIVTMRDGDEKGSYLGTEKAMRISCGPYLLVKRVPDI
jgi:hypothetical protein